MDESKTEIVLPPTEEYGDAYFASSAAANDASEDKDRTKSS
jgi:hypothetical protein